MPPRGDVPQTVGEALLADWKWLGVECQLCHRKARLPLADRPRNEKLVAIAARVRCSQCGDRSRVEYMSFTLVAVWLWEKPISFSGERAVKFTMN